MIKQRLLGLGACSLIVAVICGLPILMVMVTGNPLSWSLPAWGELIGALLRPDDGSLAIRVLACLGWLIWLYLVVVILLEIISLIRGAKAPTLPGLRMPQLAVRRVVVAAALLFVAAPLSFSATAYADSSGSSLSGTTHVDHVDTVNAVPVEGSNGPQLPVPSPAPNPPVKKEAPRPVAGQKTTETKKSPILHTVGPRDTLSGLAQQYLGDSQRWEEIFTASQDIVQPDGRTLSHPDFILDGWQLRIPVEAATAATGSPAASKPTNSVTTPAETPQFNDLYEVSKGETLSSIAAEQLGDPDRWPEIVTASSHIVQPDGSRLTNPNMINPGWRLDIPDAQPKNAVTPAQPPNTALEASSPPAQPTTPDPALAQPEGRHPGGGDALAGTQRHSQPIPPIDLADDSPASTAGATVVPAPSVAAANADGTPSLSAQKPESQPQHDGEIVINIAEPTASVSSTPVPTSPTIAEGGQAAATNTPSSTTTHDEGVQHSEHIAVSQEDRQVRLGSAQALGWAGSGLLAAAVIGLLTTARIRRNISRPVGLTFSQPSDVALRLESSLRAVADPATLADLRKIRGAIAASGMPIPMLEQAVVGEKIVLRIRGHHRAPCGWCCRMEGNVSEWVIDTQDLRYHPDVADSVGLAWPTLACVGKSGDDWLYVDLAAVGFIGLRGRHADDARLGLLLDLGTNPDVDVVVTSGDADVVRAADLTSVQPLPTGAALLALLRDRVQASAGRSVAELWVDPDSRDLARPIVVILDRAVEPQVAAELAALQSQLPCAVIGIDLPDEGAMAATAEIDTDALLWSGEDGDVACVPPTVDAQARALLTGLFTSANEPDVEPASWWADHVDNVAILPLTTHAMTAASLEESAMLDAYHPTLRLLGTIELTGARGTSPARAPRQCLEYLAWLLENPGGRASHMSAALIVAESTRRSNMSRLRTWLGNDDMERPYLPDAYSGQIHVAPEVSSDWQRLQLLIAPGVNRVSLDTLVSALKLVRGAPLADAAPGQWHWAEPMRHDMVFTIRDIGARLAELSLGAGDVEMARWATARALLAAPEDEVLLGWRIRAEHRAGNRGEVERLALRMHHHARSLDVDLADETIVLLQEVMEGGTRQRLS